MPSTSSFSQCIHHLCGCLGILLGYVVWVFGAFLYALHARFSYLLLKWFICLASSFWVCKCDSPGVWSAGPCMVVLPGGSILRCLISLGLFLLASSSWGYCWPVCAPSLFCFWRWLSHDPATQSRCIGLPLVYFGVPLVLFVLCCPWFCLFLSVHFSLVIYSQFSCPCAMLRFDSYWG